MILIPQIYLRGGKLAKSEKTTSPVFQDDAVATAKTLKSAGAEGILCVDLSAKPVGISPNLPIIKSIHDELELGVYISGSFKTEQEIDTYVNAGIELVVMGSIAYQQPEFLEKMCKKFPGKIAVHIDVKGGKVTIPGYAVASNKSPFDYAENFVKNGVRYILYSDVSADGKLDDENIERTENFCNEITARIICTSEVRDLGDVERIARIDSPRLEGLLLARSLYEGRVDFKGANTLITDIAFSDSSDVTLTEM